MSSTITSAMDYLLESPEGVLIASCIVGGAILYKLWKSHLELLFYYISPVSYPGDPSPNPVTRRGAWADRTSDAPSGWKFLTADASHEHTDKDRGSRPALTGEAAGRQIWVKADKGGSKGKGLTFNPNKNPNAGDKVLRAQQLQSWTGAKPTKAAPKTPADAAEKGVAFYQMLQCEDGHWAADYGGPMFLLPGVVITSYVSTRFLSAAQKEAMLLYLTNHQQLDGGWGTHIECASTMFGTSLNYVAARLLGMPAHDERAVKARAFIQKHGGVVTAPSWAKFWLALLGVYEWEGINSIPAELWMLPRWFPFHPGKLWCHCRMVYLPMCYLYCIRWTYPSASKDPLISDLRGEIFTCSYEQVKWDKERHTCCPLDNYSGIHWFMTALHNILAWYEAYFCWGIMRWIRDRGVAFSIAYIHEEDRQTNYVDIGPVNKPLNMLSVYADSGCDGSCEAFQRHLARVDDYLWLAEDGMKCQGYNGSQCWDTSFAIQAVTAAGLLEKFPDCSLKVWNYLARTQIPCDEEEREKYFRHESKGGWPFSTAAHGWPISDCTGEGLKGVLCLMDLPQVVKSGKEIAPERLYDAVNVLLTYQNHDGGWATYENNRGYGWYELLNPSEVFGDIMIDYSYAECTCASLTALVKFSQRYPNHRAAEIARSVSRARTFIKSIQRKDGSWYGSWGVCFTYGTWFGIEGLLEAGEPVDSKCIKKAVKFLLSQQRSNGGWGESYFNSLNKLYTAEGTDSCEGEDMGKEGSGVVETGWACLGLMHSAAHGDDAAKAALDRGIKFLMQHQLPSGDWDQEGITGVFNRSCAITYTAYRNIFPIWALGAYAQTFPDES